MYLASKIHLLFFLEGYQKGEEREKGAERDSYPPAIITFYKGIKRSRHHHHSLCAVLLH